MDERPPSNRPDRGEQAPPYLGRSGPPAPAQVSERMQSLLARAVEDQMAEQRQLQSLINEVRSALTRIQDRMDGVAQAGVVDDMRADVASLAGDLRATTAGLNDRLDAALAALSDHSRADATAARLEQVSADLEAQGQAVAALPAMLMQATAAESADTRVEMARLTSAVMSFGDSLQAEIATLRESMIADSADNARRYTEYVDNAILALAEVLLRRRGDQPARPAAPPAEPAPAAPPAPVATVGTEAPAPAETYVPEPVAAAAEPEPEPEPEPVQAAEQTGSFFRPVTETDLVDDEDLPYTEWEQEAQPAFREVNPPSPDWGPPTTPPVSLDLRDRPTTLHMDAPEPMPVPGGFDDGRRAWWRPGG